MARALTVVLLLAGGLSAQEVAHWNFDGDLGSAAGQEALMAHSAAPASAPSVTFESVEIAGAPAMVAHFTRGTYFRLRPGFRPNGGGRYLNQYSLVLDVLFPDRSPSGGWASLYQTNDRNANEGDWFVSPAGGLGVASNYGGALVDGEWHRLALVVDLVEGTFQSYLDGVKVQERTGEVIDGRFSLYTLDDGRDRDGIALFADPDGKNAEGLVDAVQIRDVALCPEDVAALGSVADGPLSREPLAARICDPIGPPSEISIAQGPYLQWATRSEMTVMWETDVPGDTTVLYRRSGAPWQEVVVDEAVLIHEIRLDGFSPLEEVEYQVRSRRGEAEIHSEVSTLRTSPDRPIDFSFTIWGDNQGNPSVFGGHVNRMLGDVPDLAVSVGDVVDNGDIYAQWGDQLLRPLQPLAKSVPFYVAIGNHERNSHWFYDYLAQPGNEHWFSFDYADCHFVIVDTNFPFAPGSDQYEWLRQDLFSDAAREARWLFAFHHHPPYSEIYEEVVYARVRQHLVPLFEAAGVDIDFTGHIHDYERGVFTPPDTGRRIVYLQTSGGGGPLWDDEFAGEWDQIDRVIQYVYHYCVVDIRGDTLEFRAVAEGGSVIDRFTLHEEPRGEGEPPPPPPPGGVAVTQWDFDAANLEPSYGPGGMSFQDGPDGATATLSAFGTTSDFGIASIGGEEASVLRFPYASVASMGFVVDHDAPANGGGVYVNDFTLLLDLYLDAASYGRYDWLGIYNSNAGNANDADAFVDLNGGGIGISGQYDGSLQPDTWHRVALVFETDGGGVVLRKYVDGTEVGAQDLGPPDGRWSLYSRQHDTPFFHFLTDDSGDASSGYLSSFLFADRALTANEIAQLGGADADGILADPCTGGDCPRSFIRGDVNADGLVDIGDALASLFYQFLGEAVRCEKTVDANDDGLVDVADPVMQLEYLFRGGAPVRVPFPKCGLDPTADDLSCAEYGICKG